MIGCSPEALPRNRTAVRRQSRGNACSRSLRVYSGVGSPYASYNSSTNSIPCAEPTDSPHAVHSTSGIFCCTGASGRAPGAGPRRVVNFTLSRAASRAPHGHVSPVTGSTSLMSATTGYSVPSPGPCIDGSTSSGYSHTFVSAPISAVHASPRYATVSPSSTGDSSSTRRRRSDAQNEHHSPPSVTSRLFPHSGHPMQSRQ